MKQKEKKEIANKIRKLVKLSKFEDELIEYASKEGLQ